MERSPSSARTCLARARRERGQNRVPLPPARITGRKSIDVDIEKLSYPTRITFAQRRANYFETKTKTTCLGVIGCLAGGYNLQIFTRFLSQPC
jgi:hypothetical protein